MKLGIVDVSVIDDGTFSLDPGAAFGVIPRPIWSRQFNLDDKGRVKLGVKNLLATDGEISVLVDGGIGGEVSDKFRSIFEINPNVRYVDQIKGLTGLEEIRMVIHSHLHFDHSGRTMNPSGGHTLFRNALMVAQEEEFLQYSHPNEITRGNYFRPEEKKIKNERLKLNSGKRINRWISTVKTGGHTPGHQAIILSSSGREIIYPGDLFPTSFHLRPNYITAIDSDPFQTLRMKKLLLKRSIRKHSLLILNHDLQMTSVYVSGDPEKPSFEAGDL